MATLTLRSALSVPLTNQQVDDNFTALNAAIGGSGSTIPTKSGTGGPLLSVSPTTTGTFTAANIVYSGTLTGGTSVIAIGTNQIYKDASGNVGLGIIPPVTPVYKLQVIGSVSATAYTSTVVTGTAPFVIASTTPVANLSIGGNAATSTLAATATNSLACSGNAATATNVAYSGLTGVVPTWNQNTTGSSASCTGNATTATNVAYSGLTGVVPTWNQNTTGTAAGLSATLAVLSGGTGVTTKTGTGSVVLSISPVFTGIPTAPTAAYTDDSVQLATTAFVKDVLGTSPALAGIPTAPTAAYTINTTQLATTAFVKNVLSTSPALAGIPTAPTAATAINTTQIATTAFVKNASMGFAVAIDRTATYLVGTVYTNTTDSPIFISITPTRTSTGDAIVGLTIGGKVVSQITTSDNAYLYGYVDQTVTLTGIVPPGKLYSVNNVSGTHTIISWIEQG